MGKKNPSKSKQEEEVVEKNAPPSSSWEEVFAAINSHKQSAEVTERIFLRFSLNDIGITLVSLCEYVCDELF